MATISWNDDDTKATIEATPSELFVIRKALRKFATTAVLQSQTVTAFDIIKTLEGDTE